MQSRIWKATRPSWISPHEIRPPFNPQTATAEAAHLLKTYHITKAVGDKYAGGYNIEAFSKCGISYRYCERDTSQNYIESLPLFASGRVRLIDNSRLIAQFAGLERRTSVTGRDRVDHGPGDRHDDISAAVAGALAQLTNKRAPMVISQAALARSAMPMQFAKSAKPRCFFGGKVNEF